MKLLHMYVCAAGWIETPAIQLNFAYVYWGFARVFEEHVENENVSVYPRVPIGTNPFKQKST